MPSLDIIQTSQWAQTQKNSLGQESIEESPSKRSHIRGRAGYETEASIALYVNFKDEIHLKWEDCNTHK